MKAFANRRIPLVAWLVLVLAVAMALEASVVLAEGTTTVTVGLTDSEGNPLSGGAVWYKGGPISPGTWFEFGMTGADGRASRDMPSGYTYDLRAVYNTTAAEQTAAVGTEPVTLAFQTSRVTVELKTCAGAPLSGAAVQHKGGFESGGTWFAFGTTGADGTASKQLFPGTYDFDVQYQQSRQVKLDQPVGNGSVVSFQTTRVTLQYSGSIQYKGQISTGTWFNFAKPSMELLPGTFTFRFDSYLTTIEVSGCELARSIVVLRLLDSNGAGLAGGTARYYDGSWGYVPGATGADGLLLFAYPGLRSDLTFEMRYNNTAQQKAQDVAANPLVTFQTAQVTLRLQDCGGTGLPGGTARYWVGGTSYWFPGGSTGAGGETYAEFFAGTYQFEMLYKGTAETKTEDVGAAVVFTTTRVTLQYSGQISYGGPTGDAAWFGKPSMELLPGGAYTFHFRGAGRMDLSWSGCEFTRSIVALKLLASTGAGLAGGTAEYYDGGWKAIPGSTGADGVLMCAIDGLRGDLTFRMAYAGASQQKAQNVADDPVVVWQTTLVTMKLLASDDTELDGGAEYYAGGWQTFGSGTTTTSMELLPLTYSFRVLYGGASLQKSQDVVADPIVIFETVSVTMKLLDSGGGELSGGAEYYGGGWRTFGSGSTTTSMELLPMTYSFRVLYGGASQQKAQNIVDDPIVVFQTTLVTMKLLDCDGNELSGGADYYGGGWRTFGGGTTTTSMELLPMTYSFRVSYGGASQQKAQDIAADPAVIFATTEVTLQYSGTIQYYAGGWQAFSSPMHMLPGTYTFHFDGYQAPLEVSGCEMVKSAFAISLKDSGGQPTAGGKAYLGVGGWPYIGSTGSNGVLIYFCDGLVGNMRVRMEAPNYGGTEMSPVQYHPTNSVYSFQTVQAVIQLVDHLGGPLDGGIVQAGFGGWPVIGTTGDDGPGTLTHEMFAGTYRFRLSYNYGTQQKAQHIDTPVVFQTALVKLHFSGTIQHGVGGWPAYTGPLEMLPIEHRFGFSGPGHPRTELRFEPAAGTVFEKTIAYVQVLKSDGTGQDGVTAEWHVYGGPTSAVPGATDANGALLNAMDGYVTASTNYEVLYAGARLGKWQNPATNSFYDFQLVEVVVELRDNTGAIIADATPDVYFHYYGSAEALFGTMSGGTVRKDLLPGGDTYFFDIKSYNAGRQTVGQKIGANPTVVFQTGKVVDGGFGCTEYWQYGGPKVTFADGIQLLPSTGGMTTQYYFTDGLTTKVLLVKAGQTLDLQTGTYTTP